MANDNVLLSYGTSGLTLYGVVTSTAATVWNDVSGELEAFDDASWTDYVLTMSEQVDSGRYVLTLPSGLPAGTYYVEVREQTDVDANYGDDPVVGTGSVEWGGSEVVPLSSRAVTGAAMTLGADERAAVADKILSRRISGGADGGRTVSQSLAAVRNKVAFDVPAVGQFTVYDVDDTTPLYTGTYARGANTLGPLTSTDPST